MATNIATMITSIRTQAKMLRNEGLLTTADAIEQACDEHEAREYAIVAEAFISKHEGSHSRSNLEWLAKNKPEWMKKFMADYARTYPEAEKQAALSSGLGKSAAMHEASRAFSASVAERFAEHYPSEDEEDSTEPTDIMVEAACIAMGHFLEEMFRAAQQRSPRSDYRWSNLSTIEQAITRNEIRSALRAALRVKGA